MLNFSAFDSLFLNCVHDTIALLILCIFIVHGEMKRSFVFNLLNNQVEWPMTIYVPAQNLKQFVEFSRLVNSNIKVLGVNTIIYNGFEKFRSFFYRVGLSSPPPQTVTNLAIFVGINTGYQNIDLFGVDHTFLSALMVNEKSTLSDVFS